MYEGELRMSLGERALAATPVSPVTAWPFRMVYGLVADKRVRFLVTGGANALVAFVVFVAFQHLLGGRWGYLWAVVATHVTTVLLGFASHRRLVFGVRGQLLRDLWRFELVQLSNLALNAVLLAIAVEALHLPPVIAQACVIVLSASYAWFGYSRFSFRRSSALE
jgi:putative flippase GtrA